jgi:hypothetical protein
MFGRKSYFRSKESVTSKRVNQPRTIILQRFYEFQNLEWPALAGQNKKCIYEAVIKMQGLISIQSYELEKKLLKFYSN